MIVSSFLEFSQKLKLVREPDPGPECGLLSLLYKENEGEQGKAE